MDKACVCVGSIPRMDHAGNDVGHSLGDLFIKVK